MGKLTILFYYLVKMVLKSFKWISHSLFGLIIFLLECADVFFRFQNDVGVNLVKPTIHSCYLFPFQCSGNYILCVCVYFFLSYKPILVCWFGVRFECRRPFTLVHRPIHILRSCWYSETNIGSRQIKRLLCAKEFCKVHSLLFSAIIAIII